MVFEGKTIYKADATNSEEAIKSVWLEYLHELMSRQSQKITKIDEDVTEIFEELTNPSLCPDYLFFMSPINHTIKESGIRYDSTAFLKSILEKRKHYPLKGLIHGTIREIEGRGVKVTIPKKIEFKEDGSFEAEC